MMKSFEKPRPMELMPCLSCISQAFGDPGLTTIRAIALSASEQAHPAEPPPFCPSKRSFWLFASPHFA
jgi:hypothetical protein